MKILRELVEDVEVITEAKEDGQKNYYIQGPFLIGEQKNKNGRIYPIHVLEKEVARYTKEYINENRAFGELNHPSGPTINLDRVSHMHKSLIREGNNFIGRAKILDTPMGKIAKSLIDEGAKLGTSSRGLGTLKNKAGLMEVQDDFMLATAGDLVSDPSGPGCWLDAVFEDKEWVYSNGNWETMEVINSVKEDLHKLSAKQIAENKIRYFDAFLQSL